MGRPVGMFYDFGDGEPFSEFIVTTHDDRSLVMSLLERCCPCSFLCFDRRQSSCICQKWPLIFPVCS